MRLTVIVLAAFYLCSIPLQASSQQHSRIMQQKTAALLGDYKVSFRSTNGVLRYILHIDSVQGMFFYGRLENDKYYHPKRDDRCYIKGILAERGKYDFVMKPWMDRNHPYTLPCLPHEWLLNNKVYFSFKEENIISGYMIVQNDSASPPYKFSGMKHELPPDIAADSLAENRPIAGRKFGPME